MRQSIASKMSSSPQRNSPDSTKRASRAAQPLDGSIASLKNLYLDQLRDICSVERQLIPALGELEDLASSEPLRRLLRRHTEETRRQKERLEQIGRNLRWDLGGDSSQAMEGLIAGGRDHVAEVEFLPARDFLIIAHAHRIENYELAAYSVTVALADRLERGEDSRWLRASLDEERAVNDALTRLAYEDLLNAIPAE